VSEIAVACGITVYKTAGGKDQIIVDGFGSTTLGIEKRDSSPHLQITSKEKC